MAKKKLKEDIKEKTIAELKMLLLEVRRDIAKITVEKNAGRLKNVSLLGHKKKKVAQILTVLNQKELNKV